MEIQTSDWILALLGPGSVLLFSFLLFLFYLKDMFNRKEKIVFWAIIFLLTGPIGLTFYLSYRKLKNGEKRAGRRLHHLSKNFIIPWTLYILLGSLIIVGIIIGYDYYTGGISNIDHIMEAIFWFGIIYIIFVIPLFIVIPSIIALIVMFKTKKEA